MESIDLNILKFISTRENNEAYRDFISKALCTKESWSLVVDINKYFDEHPACKEINNDDFGIWQRVTNRPSRKPEEHLIYERIIGNALSQPSPSEESSFLRELLELKARSKVESLYERWKVSSITTDEFLGEASESLRVSTVAGGEETLQSLSLESLAESQRTDAGYYWRLEDLNRSIGPIRKGDFIIIAKRPEVGGTSFLCSEMSFMLEQMEKEGNGIIFNNEESPDKVFGRMATSSLGKDYRNLLASPFTNQAEYESWLAGRTWDLDHDTTMTMHSIESRLGEKEYGLIGINVLLKVGGTRAKEDHDKLQALGEWGRRVAQEHGPVLAIVQADPSAEGMRYIPQDRIYKSKTALQGEADALIMIGKDDDLDDTKRFIHVAKNKMPPSLCTELLNKHIKSEVAFDISTGRFTSINYKGNSRDG